MLIIATVRDKDYCILNSLPLDYSAVQEDSGSRSFKTHSDQLREKEEIGFSPMTKAPTPTEMSKGQSDNTNNATKKFDYTVIADRLRTVIWSNYGHPTGKTQNQTRKRQH